MAKHTELQSRYREVMDRVGEATVRSGRRPGDVLVVAVTKTASPDQIRQMVQWGHSDFGESRVQQLQQRATMITETLERRRMMSAPGESPAVVRWHMIGHLQRNKVRVVLPLVKLIHSVDSLLLAEEIQMQATRDDADVEVLLQVNISGETSKQGLAPAAVPYLAEQVHMMAHLHVRGLMTMAPYSDNAEDSRDTFQRCRDLFEELRSAGRLGKDFNILSMGMTNDYEVALECGANVVRIGRALFGDVVPAEV